MSDFKVQRLRPEDIISYGPMSNLAVLIGDEQGGTPIRAALQTCQPGYEVPVHHHPYIEYLIVMEGSAEFVIERGDGGVDKVELHKGDSVELGANVWHSFSTSRTEVTQLLGIHLARKRIVNYREGVKTDERGFRLPAQ
ncbi:cupin domain-containing protein [Ramlibacter sp. AW1]|uniref:Cupin domain-containing protein n=1 Tax=Ramlibacter aurantiacus TaxID=2801330 RepID=A0A936ZMS2_9BURK|nr:cupin domain-containing protein [Ramlibacter aurantiacus]MBL0423043.1 cupin domain-containing protein [Ramlibacter aurantiacus]